MTVLLYLTFLVLTRCGRAVGSSVLQLESTVRVQPGLSTSLECHVLLDGHFLIFWIKIPLNEAPVCVATAKSFVDDVAMCKHFENNSRIKVTWNQKTFNLSFLSVEHTDIATYICGTYSYGQYTFGNGSKLIFEEHTGVCSGTNKKLKSCETEFLLLLQRLQSLNDLAVSPNTNRSNDEKDVRGEKQVFEYLVAVLAASNGASVFLIIFLCRRLTKNKSGVTSEVSTASDSKTDELNYAALNFGQKQRRTGQKRTNEKDTTVVYGAVRHQEEL